MTKLSRAALEAFFETDDVPTQAEFADFIESVPNFVDDAISETKLATVAISSAQILALSITPITLVAAPGPTEVIIPLFCTITYTFVTIAYISDPVLFVGTLLPVNFMSSPPGILNQSINLVKQMAVTYPTANLEAGVAVKLSSLVPTTGGQGTLKVNLGYTIIDTA